jgi:enoyl-CoA hydratase
MTSAESSLVVERRGSVLVATLNRPEARNAMDRATRVHLVRVCAEADDDPDISVVVLTGTDPSFSGGVDLKEALSGEGYRPPRTNPGQALRAMTTPVICAVNGPCVSGALEVALSCSFAIASERARFADTHARVGLLPSWGLSALLPQAIGVRRARQMTLSGDFIAADRALAWGLVNEVVPHEQLLARALGLAASIDGVAAATRRAVLSLYSRGEGAPLATGLGLEAEAHALWSVDDATARDRFAATVARGSSAKSTALT